MIESAFNLDNLIEPLLGLKFKAPNLFGANAIKLNRTTFGIEI